MHQERRSRVRTSNHTAPSRRSRVPGLRPGAKRVRPHLGEEDKSFSPGELAKLLAWYARRADLEEGRKVRHGPRRRDLVLVELLILTGLRASEAARLQVGDLHLDPHKPYLRVRGGKARTSREVDTVPLHPRLCPLLRTWCAGQRPEEPLFRRQGGAPFDRRDVWEVVKRGIRACKLREVLNVHALRHAFISMLARLPEASPMQVARLARLRSVNLVDRYFHDALDTKRTMVNAIVIPRAPRGA